MKIMLKDKIKIKKIEIDLTDHCNLKCNCCDHSSNLLSEKFNSVDEILNDLRVLSEVVEIEELLIAGGEPLLHKDLIYLLEELKKDEDGFGKNITLITNGLLLHKTPERLWELVDGIWISIYPGVKLPLKNIELFKERAEKYKIWVWTKLTESFTKTFLNHQNRNEKVVNFIYKSCIKAHTLDCHVVRHGRYFKCTQSPFISDRLKLKGENYDNINEDSVQIHDNPNLKEELINYLKSDMPLKACSYCLGGIGIEVEHNQSDCLETQLYSDDSDTLKYINEELRIPIANACKKGKKLKKAGDFINIYIRRYKNNKAFKRWEDIKKENIGKVFSLDANAFNNVLSEGEKEESKTEKTFFLYQITLFKYAIKYHLPLSIIQKFIWFQKK